MNYLVKMTNGDVWYTNFEPAEPVSVVNANVPMVKGARSGRGATPSPVRDVALFTDQIVSIERR
jgi:hypothetical protein